ncbi:hypothetical protein JW921_08910 [Candidatus Fermentibacterales bacterium]|nr:hypothetical protein [Candidatus Fermentibacterales bacterium]
MSDESSFQQVAKSIWDNAVAEGFRGYDPYDGLNSRFLWPVVKRSRFMRLALQQAVKRSPLNLRPLIGVRPGLNPKGLALFLRGAANARFIELGDPVFKQLGQMLLAASSTPQGVQFFGQDRESLESREVTPEEVNLLQSGRIGWGYDFPWQGKGFFLPAFFPTAVCTCFVVEALRKSRHKLYEPIARAAARFVNFDLACARMPEGICFSYSPRDDTCIYNASLYAAKLLALGWKSGGPALWRDDALEAVRFVISTQREDGSWVYGKGNDWDWVDGLHTGFVLETLEDLARILGTDDFDHAITNGLAYYSEKLFESDGTALSKPGERYPMDPHTYAQGAITFLRLDRHCPDSRPFAASILRKAIGELWDPDEGVFRTRSSPKSTQSTRFIRWSQAWMFRALAYSISKGSGPK